MASHEAVSAAWSKADNGLSNGILPQSISHRMTGSMGKVGKVDRKRGRNDSYAKYATDNNANGDYPIRSHKKVVLRQDRNKSSNIRHAVENLNSLNDDILNNRNAR